MYVKKKCAESKVKEIRSHTRKKYSAEEKIKILVEDLRGATIVAELCRKEDINANLYYTTGLTLGNRPRLLYDNGSYYVSNMFKEFLYACI